MSKISKWLIIIGLALYQTITICEQILFLTKNSNRNTQKIGNILTPFNCYQKSDFFLNSLLHTSKAWWKMCRVHLPNIGWLLNSTFQRMLTKQTLQEVMRPTKLWSLLKWQQQHSPQRFTTRHDADKCLTNMMNMFWTNPIASLVVN